MMCRLLCWNNGTDSRSAKAAMIPPAGFRRGCVRMPDHPAANRKKRRFPKQVPQWDLLWEFSVFLGLLKQEILHFFNSIKAAIKSRYGILDIKICVVPGNHDIDYLKGDRGASGLANIEDHRSYDKHISEELEKQEQFYILARRYNCFKQSGLVDKREFIHKNSLKINIFPLSGWRSFIRFAT